jgi:hypothetical protein
MEWEILFCWYVLKVPLFCALGHIHVCYSVFALHMPTGGYCFWCTGCVLGSVTWSYASFVRYKVFSFSSVAVNICTAAICSRAFVYWVIILCVLCYCECSAVLHVVAGGLLVSQYREGPGLTGHLGKGYQIHTKHINTLWGQNVKLLNVKLAVHIVTTGL